MWLKQIVYSGYSRLCRTRLPQSLPPWISGSLDWHLLPKNGDSLGGPFNGQRGRSEIFRQILQCMDFRAVVETGTFRGTTTVYLRRTSGLPVYTIEAVPRSFYCARKRFKSEDGIHYELGDSRLFLEKLGRKHELGGSLFFYLDAHWHEDLPLNEELQVIARSWPEPVIMIDDFEVPDDPGYAFDDYGPGKRLAVSYLSEEFLRDFCLFWPSLRGEEESGLRRGCVVICRRGATAQKLAKLPALREDSRVREQAR